MNGDPEGEDLLEELAGELARDHAHAAHLVAVDEAIAALRRLPYPLSVRALLALANEGFDGQGATSKALHSRAQEAATALVRAAKSRPL